MNVWTIGNRPRGYKPAKTSMPPRKRDGQEVSGGSNLRKRLKNLHRRLNAYDALSEKNKAGNTRPGSMNK